MSGEVNTRAIVYDESGRKELARVVLNGYNITAGGPLGRHGTMRSFKIEDGVLWDQWSLGTRLVIRAEDGQQAFGRIAAHPAAIGAVGLIEFLR